MSQEEPFQHGLPVLQKLLFSDFQSDVIFRVGTNGEMIHAHKLILATASSVFHAQFNGAFAEAQQNNLEKPIVIEDIEPDIFRVILRYIYTEEACHRASNVMDVFFAADKYLLTGLTEICEQFVEQSITTDNVLELFRNNYRHIRNRHLPDIDKICLKTIRDNPIKCFQHRDFLKLPEEALIKITASERMNCSMDQLLDAVEKWRNANKSGTQFQVNLSDMQCRELRITGDPFNRCIAVSDVEFNVSKSLYLYGLGIFVGIKEKPYEDFVANRSLTITVIVESHELSVTKQVVSRNDVYVQPIFFEKLEIKQNCKIHITIGGAHERATFFGLKAFHPEDRLGEVNLTASEPVPINRPMGRGYIYSEHKERINFVDYLLYDVTDS